mgnify:CR=1 FL=1
MFATLNIYPTMNHAIASAITVTLAYFTVRSSRKLFFINLTMFIALISMYVISTLNIDIGESISLSVMLTQGVILGHELYIARAAPRDAWDMSLRWPQISFTTLTILFYIRTNFSDVNPFWFLARYNSLGILATTRHRILSNMFRLMQIGFLFTFFTIFLVLNYSRTDTMLYGLSVLPWQVSKAYSDLITHPHQN